MLWRHSRSSSEKERRAYQRGCARYLCVPPHDPASKHTCMCVCARAPRVCCSRVQLDVLGCAASQDAMREMTSKNGRQSDKGVLGAEEDFPLFTDEVRGRRQGGDHLPCDYARCIHTCTCMYRTHAHTHARARTHTHTHTTHTHTHQHTQIEAWLTALIHSRGLTVGAGNGVGSRCRIA